MPTLSDFVTPRDVALRLPLKFDAARLLADLERMPEAWWHAHLGPYHDGNWEAIALWAPNGRRTEQSSKGGAFAATEALRLCDYVPEVINAFPGRKNRIRFLKLRAGGHIFAHSDPLHQIDTGIVRIHVPVRTNPSVDFTVHGRRIVMQAGQAWYVDVRFRHSVDNPGGEDRVHLVIDVVPNPELTELFARAASSGKGMLTGYFLKHSLPRRLVRRFGLAN
ncbi:aspartyl/asparaginyl beta-hydroxylase domain-containing protein [Bradyrhizobium sp.]|uniref:aspartyl/asparaginyl beta-hydroxylase domain-containing protein n=1 Tax=Bradyrhizobium sp. TaxID=376 RepID=UPI003C75EF50